MTSRSKISKICFFCLIATISVCYYYMYNLIQEFPSLEFIIYPTLNAYYLHSRENALNLEEHRNFTNQSLPVVVKPIGGLGNQLFQYSTAYAVARKRNSDLYICVDRHTALLIEHEKNRKTFQVFNSLDRSYSLDIFNVPQDKLLVIPRGESQCNYSELPGGNFSAKDISLFHEIEIISGKIPKDKVVQLYGYTESEIFFADYKDELRKLLHVDIEPLPSELENILLQMNQSESVAVHVRRGDFVSNPNDDRSIPLRYYTRALKLITEVLATKNVPAEANNITFFVFSDDIEGVKKDFRQIFQNESYHMVFLSNKKFSRIIDFYLMSRCRHVVIANSTFSWWAAYLNPHKNKIVIAPLPKFLRSWLKTYAEGELRNIAKKVYTGEWAYPKEWITINPFKHEGSIL